MVNAPETVGAGKNIWIAASDGDFARVQELIESGTSPNAADENTYTPMHAAASWGHVEVLRYLQQKGGNINLTDEDGDTPLYAVESIDMARIVVELGGDVSHRNGEGLTAADSLEEEHPEVATYLRSVHGGPSAVARDPESAEDEAMAVDPTDDFTSDLLSRARAVMAEAEASGTQDDPAVEEKLREIVTEAVARSVGAGRAIGEEDVRAAITGGPAQTRPGPPASASAVEDEPSKRTRTE